MNKSFCEGVRVGFLRAAIATWPLAIAFMLGVFTERYIMPDDTETVYYEEKSK